MKLLPDDAGDNTEPNLKIFNLERGVTTRAKARRLQIANGSRSGRQLKVQLKQFWRTAFASVAYIALSV